MSAQSRENSPWGKYHCTAGLDFNKIAFDQKENMWLLVGSQTVESKLVKLEASWIVILPPKENFLIINNMSVRLFKTCFCPQPDLFVGYLVINERAELCISWCSIRLGNWNVLTHAVSLMLVFRLLAPNKISQSYFWSQIKWLIWCKYALKYSLGISILCKCTDIAKFRLDYFD